MKLTTKIAAAAAALLLVAGPALAQKTMRLAHLNPDSPFDSHSGAMAAVFKNLVETGTNGSVKVQIFANGQLDKDNEVIQQVRNEIGPVASFKIAAVVERLPKTRSGKVLRGTMKKIADNEPYRQPATIDDPAILNEITAALQRLGYGTD